MKKLNYFASLAHIIINNNKEFASNKTIISNLFKIDNESKNVELIKNRLTIIDSYYSTQMSKRLYGIEDLANSLSAFSDNELKKEVILFLQNPKEKTKINELFTSKYGIDKSGNQYKKAISIISKYLYFLNEFNFPIYDSLAINSYKLLQKNNILAGFDNINETNYFECINKLNSKSEIENYEKLDNLLWLIGKLQKGSFSLLVNKEQYLQIINLSDIKNNLSGIKSEEKDLIIREEVRNNYFKTNLFSSEQQEFFEFAFGLINKYN